MLVLDLLIDVLMHFTDSFRLGGFKSLIIIDLSLVKAEGVKSTQA